MTVSNEGKSRVTAAAGEYLALYAGLSLLALLCLAWSPLALGLYHFLPERWGRSLGRRMITAGFRFYVSALSHMGACRFDLSALDGLRDQPALIIAANHPSLLDAVMIVSRLSGVCCILKAELMDSILFGAGARLARYIRNEPPVGMILEAVADLGRGNHLLLFPEGTRSTRTPVNPFKSSLGLIASRAKVPVQTVFIETDSPFLGKRWPLSRRPGFPISYRLRLGRRFDTPGNVREFMLELERYYVDELGSVSPGNPHDRDERVRYPSRSDPQLQSRPEGL